ncbi:MAG: hypothetical protein QOH16_3520 [Gaiellaceae bacterium]|nr:hypothetical protein [Gaiellaceae bacterium]
MGPTVLSRPDSTLMSPEKTDPMGLGVPGSGSIALDASGENRSEVSPHTLRRTFGSDLLNRGARIEVVSRQLGRANTKVAEQAVARLLTATQRSELLQLAAAIRSLSATTCRCQPHAGCLRRAAQTMQFARFAKDPPAVLHLVPEPLSLH